MRIIFEATLGYISIMKHMSISKWLSQLGLPQYCTLFDEEYDGVEVKSAHTVSLDTHTHACHIQHLNYHAIIQTVF